MPGIAQRVLFDPKTKIILANYDPTPAATSESVRDGYLNRTFALPRALPSGQIAYRADVCYGCNLLQQFVRPLCVPTPNLIFCRLDRSDATADLPGASGPLTGSPCWARSDPSSLSLSDNPGRHHDPATSRGRAAVRPDDTCGRCEAEASSPDLLLTPKKWISPASGLDRVMAEEREGWSPTRRLPVSGFLRLWRRSQNFRQAHSIAMAGEELAALPERCSIAGSSCRETSPCIRARAPDKRFDVARL